MANATKHAQVIMIAALLVMVSGVGARWYVNIAWKDCAMLCQQVMIYQHVCHLRQATRKMLQMHLKNLPRNLLPVEQIAGVMDRTDPPA